MYPGRLRGLRNENNKTQQQMADILGITRQGYANYENDNTEPDNDTLNRLADYFDVSIDYLMGRTDNKKSSVIYGAANLKMSPFLKKAMEIAKERGMDLDDPRILESLDIAFDIAKRMNENKQN